MKIVKRLQIVGWITLAVGAVFIGGAIVGRITMPQRPMLTRTNYITQEGKTIYRDRVEYKYLILTNIGGDTNAVPDDCRSIALAYNTLLDEYRFWIESDPMNVRQSNDAIYFDIVRNKYRIPYTLPAVSPWGIAPMFGYSTSGWTAGASCEWRGIGATIIFATNFVGALGSFRFNF